jgi:Ca2+-transporting ATPase
MATEWYKLSIPETLAELDTNAETGLSAAEATSRAAEYGPNEIEERAGRSRLAILAEQFTGILTIMLIIASGVSFFLGDWIEAVAILIIVILNGILGYTQEYRAEQSMEALRRMAVPTVRVRRDARAVEISAREVVPGDIVILETGNIVPADGRVILSANMRIEEAALTGESEPVAKDAEAQYDTDKALGDRRNMVYSGTTVNYGRGEFAVTGTAMNTELGKIATMIQSVEDDPTPLQERLDRLGKVLAYAAIGLVIVVIGLGWLRGQRDVEELLLTAVSLAVAAVPEALTAVVTIALSLGAQRMLKREALIRKLPAVETLGSTTVICSDKTGTLTVNRMTVTAVDLANHTFNFVQDENEPMMQLVPADETPISRGTIPTLDLLLVAGALNNDAVLVPNEGRTDTYHAVGDPTEGALILAAAADGLLKPDLDKAFPRVAEVPFDSVRKRMTTIHRSPESADDVPASLMPFWERRLDPDSPLPRYLAFTKGAIDGILEHSNEVWVEGEVQPLDDEWTDRIMVAHDEMAANGMRVLGVALRPWDKDPDAATDATAENDLIFVGLFGMIDPPRPEVSEAVRECRAAGIRPVMITGDHPLTARHIAQQIGITQDDRFMTGQELDKLSAEELSEVVRDISVFARVSPENKLQLIEAYQLQDNIVAMTGDGVNDAPALKRADIGVAMGITGTDVAKGAADMVLLDDNFATIVAAVEEGRVIYDNIRRFIKYLLTCNVSEIAVMIIGPFLGLPLPLLPLQILWMNLVTDGLPALALGVEAPEKGVMNRPPFTATESVFGRGMVRFIILFGVLMSVIAIGNAYGLWAAGDEAWQTTLFTTLVFSQLAMALAVRSEEQSIFTIGLFSNRYMILALIVTVTLQFVLIYWGPAQLIFNTVALPARDLALSFGLSFIVLASVEIYKWFLRRQRAAAEQAATQS